MGSIADEKGITGTPVHYKTQQEANRVFATTLNAMQLGALRNTGEATLNASATSTTVSDARAGVNSVILCMATESKTEAALAQWSIRTRTNGAFTITHQTTSASVTDATVAYAIFG